VFETNIWLTMWTVGVMLALVSIVVAVVILLWRATTKRRGDFEVTDPGVPRDRHREI